YIDRHIATNKTIILLDNSANFRARSIVKQILNGKPYALPRTQLISNVRLLDGTGAPAVASNLRIVEDRISDTGQLQPFPGEPVVDGRGLVLAPGFIDSHSHHERGFQRDPSAISCTNQGITTIVTGQDGESIPVDSLKAMLAMQPVSVNVATYTGHASLREKAMKGDVLRAASTAEVDAMKQLLKEDIEKGSLGLSTGLEYEEGFYSTKQEVISLAKTTAAMGGRYISHIRSEDVNLLSSIEEIIQIGAEARLPVQISHFKIALRSKWGTATGLLARLQQARAAGVNITADVYPYTMWSSTPRVLFPKKDFENEASAAYAARELFDPAASVITHFSANSAYEGKTISQIAIMHNESDPKALIRIVREAGSDGAAIAGASMSEDDVVNFMKWNYSNICSDGADGGHPRGYGAFTRVLGRYVREQKIMPLETAIYKMTGLTAEHLGFTNRGLIARNYFADLVLFDPATVGDWSTMTDSKELSAGIEMVWVNGQLVYQQQQATPARPGRFIAHE
ncbi:MAG: amidohydrolase family protein, partial [Bacteroidota bacterium]|nr:amidohydrolase family protein [Bacteroidota bacterium]